MKILYVAYRHDPRNPDLASGADYNFYQALLRNGIEVKVVGPFTHLPPVFLERVLKRLYKLHPHQRYVKYNLTNTWRASQAVNQADGTWKPDLIFTLAPSPLVFYTGNTPCVFRTDTTFLGMHAHGAEFLQHGKVALRLMVWQEKRAFRKCAKVITQSEWSRRILLDDYHLPADKVIFFANPSALPNQVIPDKLSIQERKQLQYPLRLLLVGRESRRKGVDVAVEIAERLNAGSILAELTIVGLGGNSSSYVRYAGLYIKSDPDQLRQYAEHYARAHLLLHPARFDASPIVTSEAAAFGTPTITNDVGGLATSVKDGESGVVLPKASPPEAYVRAILGFLRNPDKYYDLCQKTRQRYERELNWDVAGQRVAAILREVVRENNQTC